MQLEGVDSSHRVNRVMPIHQVMGRIEYPNVIMIHHSLLVVYR